LLRKKTSVSNDWIAPRLSMEHPGSSKPDDFRLPV
jgi:hypothetical protein